MFFIKSTHIPQSLDSTWFPAFSIIFIKICKKIKNYINIIKEYPGTSVEFSVKYIINLNIIFHFLIQMHIVFYFQKTLFICYLFFSILILYFYLQLILINQIITRLYRLIFNINFYIKFSSFIQVSHYIILI